MESLIIDVQRYLLLHLSYRTLHALLEVNKHFKHLVVQSGHLLTLRQRVVIKGDFHHNLANRIGECEFAAYYASRDNIPFQAMTEITANYALLRPYSLSPTPLCAYLLRDLTLPPQPLPVYTKDTESWCTVRKESDRVAWSEGSKIFYDLNTKQKVAEKHSIVFQRDDDGLGEGIALDRCLRGSSLFSLVIDDQHTDYYVKRHNPDSKQYHHPYYLVKSDNSLDLNLLLIKGTEKHRQFTTYNLGDRSICAALEPPFFVFSSFRKSVVYYLHDTLEDPELVTLLTIEGGYLYLSVSQDAKGQRFASLLSRYSDRVEILTLNLPRVSLSLK